MDVLSCVRPAVLLSLAVVAFTLGGCTKSSPPRPEAAQQATPAAAGAFCSVAENWCLEHGVPEDICGRCNPKVAAACQQKGDWCKTHSRPESQCFLCNPQLEARFAAAYEARYGKKPPQPPKKT